MSDPQRDALVDELAWQCGIESEYVDNAGQVHITSRETKEALLKSMGLRLESAADLQRAVSVRRNRPWNRLLEPVLVVSQDNLPANWHLHLPLPGDQLPENLIISWELVDEAGQIQCLQVQGQELRVAETRRLEEHLYGRLELPLPPNLALGYYDLRVQVQARELAQQGHMRLIVAPERAFIPAVLQAGHRAWGLNFPLYALRRQQGWGIGDFGDLLHAVTWAGGELHAGLVGFNPWHALSPRFPEEISPYAPSSRLYRCPLYLDIEAIPELAHCPAAQTRLAQPAFQAERERLNRSEQVDYAAVFSLKRRFLELLFDTFLTQHGPPDQPRTARGEAFARFVAAEGEPLHSFALFQSLADHWQQQNLNARGWLDWPPPYRDPQSEAVRDYVRQHRRAIQFQQYIQWLIEEQVQRAVDQAQDLGMSVGLYPDLALGVDYGGHDTWANPELYALEVEIGAPPDAFNPQGQNWGLPPLIPERLRESGYQHFIATLRRNCRQAGALRLDHVMGLFRLFWIPKGKKPSDGTYVRYFPEDLLRILALESVRHQTVIIGEDLGTVPAYIRETLARHQILSYRLFYFERTPSGAFSPPEDYPALALASVTTHDLPTLAGFWRGRDIEVKEQLQLYPRPEMAHLDRQVRDHDKHCLLAALQARDLLPAGISRALVNLPDLPEEGRWGVIAYLAQTPCRLLALNLEDIFGGLEQQNLPGTTSSYPNWRLKMPWTLAQLRESPQARRLAALMARYRPGIRVSGREAQHPIAVITSSDKEDRHA